MHFTKKKEQWKEQKKKKNKINALWWPNWEGNPKKKGYMYTYS